MRPFLKFLLLACLCAGSAAAEVTVFAAASLKAALDEVNAGFDQDVTAAYASSAALSRQITQGAPADVFISANQQWMDVLADQDLLVPDTRHDLLGNRLVIVSHHFDARFDWPTLPVLLQNTHLAMGLYNAVPAGIYAREALTHLGIWDDVAPRVVQTDHVRAALNLVVLQEVGYAMVYATDAQTSDVVHVLETVPSNAHQPIRYPAALVADTAEAHAYLAYLHSAKAKAIFAEHGFLTEGLE